MPITVNEGGVKYEFGTIYANEGGVKYELDTVTANEGGTKYEIHSGWKEPELVWKDSKNSTTFYTGNTGTIPGDTITKVLIGNWDYTTGIKIDYIIKVPQYSDVTVELGARVLGTISGSSTKLSGSITTGNTSDGFVTPAPIILVDNSSSSTRVAFTIDIHFSKA